MAMFVNSPIILWEGSGYSMLKPVSSALPTPFEEGFRPCSTYQPKQIIVSALLSVYWSFGQKDLRHHRRTAGAIPDISMNCLPEMGSHPQLFSVLRERKLKLIWVKCR